MINMMQADDTAEKLANDTAMPVFSIELVDDYCSFFAGEVIKGYVHLNLKRQISDTNIRIRLFG